MSCFIKIQNYVTFPVPACPGCPRKETVKRVVCLSVCLPVPPKIGVLPSETLSQTLNQTISLIFCHGSSTVTSVVSLIRTLQFYRTERPPSFATRWRRHRALRGLSMTAKMCVYILLASKAPEKHKLPYKFTQYVYVFEITLKFTF